MTSINSIQGWYISAEDLKTYLGCNKLAQVSDRVNGNNFDEDKIFQAIENAEGIISSYLVNTVYTLPIKCADNSVPALLKNAALWIATFMFYETRSTDEVKYRYENAIKFLDDLKSSKVGLVCNNGIEPDKISNEEYAGIVVNVEQPKSYFNNCTPCDDVCVWDYNKRFK
ncbi:MAG TPA: DUF1320 domain-containing protein [Bacteroidia bacterium]|nr:DUF1320 domain-containing protein [Bacteroidia bacterium]